jgi:hypothetical protein
MDETVVITKMPTGAAHAIERLAKSEKRQDRDDDDDRADEIDDAVHDFISFP